MIDRANKEFIEFKVELLERDKTLLQKQIDKYLKNKDNSLEDRWEVWTKYSTTNSGDWIHHWDSEFDEMDSSWSFDDYINDGEYIGRGNDIDYNRIINSYTSYLENASEEAEEE